MKRSPLNERWLRRWDRVAVVLYWLGQSALVMAIVAIIVSWWVDISSRWFWSGASVGVSCCVAWLVVRQHQALRMLASLEELTANLSKLRKDRS